MDSIWELCERLEIPGEITEQVVQFDNRFDYGSIDIPMKKLFAEETWEEGRAEIKGVLGEDPKGIGILACMLKCALQTYDDYRKLGINEQIYLDTMKCFPRFIKEHKVSYGIYGFDRDFWTARQIAGKLLRIGELEYEMRNVEGQRFISIHIPSDTKLKKELLARSYDGARLLIARVFPEYEKADMKCESWLLAPALQRLLPEGSNILEFQKSFEIEKVEEDAKDVMEWVFQNPHLSLDEAPENTSLQRKMKQYLLQGGKVGIAFGKLLEPGFR